LSFGSTDLRRNQLKQRHQPRAKPANHQRREVKRSIVCLSFIDYVVACSAVRVTSECVARKLAEAVPIHKAFKIGELATSSVRFKVCNLGLYEFEAIEHWLGPLEHRHF
jgi:hypothetical protein